MPTVAVVFGGLSAEHDVSILSATEAMDAIDSSRWQVVPVYIDPDNNWWTGDALRLRRNYLLSDTTKEELSPVRLHMGPAGASQARLIVDTGGWLVRQKAVDVDLIFPIMHGTYGEDGGIMSLCDMAQAPYVGARPLSSALVMNKRLTKQLVRAVGVPTVSEVVLSKDGRGQAPTAAVVRQLLAKVSYPVCVKPNNLGSSIGVGRADNIDDVLAQLPALFDMDNEVLVEPFVANLVEYNIAVTQCLDGTVRTSAIEEPIRRAATYDFKTKYLSQGGSKKMGNAPKAGLISATRTVNPPSLPAAVAEDIRRHATTVFTALELAGAPRLDFMYDTVAKKLYFNEVNPIPGSLGYFLWAQATPSVSYTELLNALMEEGLNLSRRNRRLIDPVAAKSVVFPRTA